MRFSSHAWLRGAGMAHREPDEENDYLCNRQFEEHVQDQVPAQHLHVHVVLWDESPDDAAEKGEARETSIVEVKTGE